MLIFFKYSTFFVKIYKKRIVYKNNSILVYIKIEKNMSQQNKQEMSQTKTAKTKQTKSSQSGVLTPTELNHEQMTITAPRKRNDKLIGYLIQDGQPVYSQSPWLFASFGVSCFEPKGQTGDKKSGKQWSINVSGRPLEEEDSDIVNNYFGTW